MPVTNEKLNKTRLIEQSLAYLVTGIFLSISHYIHEYSLLVFFGHLLISSSLLILISLILNLRWMHRVSAPLGIFSGAIFIISFAAGIIIFFVDEFVYYKDSGILSDSLTDSLFITVLITVVVWVFFLYIPCVLPALRTRLPFRKRLPSFILLVALALFIVNNQLTLFPDLYFLSGELVLLLVVMSILHKDKFAKFRRTIIYLSHLFPVLFLVFGLGSIVAFFTKASSYWSFLTLSLISLGLFVISTLLLNHWRKRLFRILQRYFIGTVSKFINIIMKITNIIKPRMTILFSTFIIVKERLLHRQK
jgi:hypothetical protein